MDKNLSGLKIIDYQPGVFALIKRKPYFSSVTAFIVSFTVFLLIPIILIKFIFLDQVIPLLNGSHSLQRANIIIIEFILFTLFFLTKYLNLFGGEKVIINQSGIIRERYWLPFFRKISSWKWSEIDHITTEAKISPRSAAKIFSMFVFIKNKTFPNKLIYLSDISEHKNLASELRSILNSFNETKDLNGQQTPEYQGDHLTANIIIALFLIALVAFTFYLYSNVSFV